MPVAYSYRTPFGLPVRYTLESDTHIENEFLFGIYEYIFTGNGLDAVAAYFVKAALLAFPNHIDTNTIKAKPHYAKLSHDQTTAYFAFDYMSTEKHLYKIPYPKDLHPRDVIYYGALKKNPLILLTPLLYIFCAASLYIPYRLQKGKLVPKLSGELLWILRYEAIKHDKLLRFLFWPIKKMIKHGAGLRYGSVKNLVKEYFYNDIEHPIIKGYNYEIK